ncbi:MAG: penicillin acylase family protein [Spirochaetia bacterium]
MRTPIKVLLISLGALLLLVLVAGAAVLITIHASFPRTRGTLTVKGLNEPVEVLRDRSGVPHIRARTMHDLYFAQGFVTAQERFWQMEFWRRIGSGRLSELFGKATLGTDIYIRTVGFRRIADLDYAAMSQEARDVYQAYADGVNAYILNRPARKLSLEFALLQLQGVKLQIEPWVTQNSLTWLKLMSQDLGANMRRELYTIDLIHTLGLPLAREFFGRYRAGEMPFIVPDSELKQSLLRKDAFGVSRDTFGLSRGASAVASPAYPSPSAEQLAALDGVSTRLVGGFDPGSSLAMGTGAGIGSNNWVIAGSRTVSGKPLLANDPHLGIQMPSIWEEVDLYCSAQDAQMGKRAGAAFHVRGFTFAGTPGVVVGHNDRIAWGVTNVNPDVQDLYIERINPENPNQYEVNGRWVDMKIHREEIRVLHQDEPVIVLARETRHGPLITDQEAFAGYRGFAINPHGEFPMNLDLKALSLHWTALQANHTVQTVLGINDARNFTDFRESLKSWDVPSQNFVYADVDGNIGYQTPGLIPIRRKGDGSVPSPGWTDEYEWTGFVPFQDLPWSFNPAKGYVVSANNPVASGSYRYFIGLDFDEGYRARRIVEMVEGAGKKLSLADMEAMQGDTLNTSAREITPYLAGLALKDKSAQARDLLMKWDFKMQPESNGAAIYAYFWQSLIEEIFKDKLPGSLWNPDTGLESSSRLMNTVFLMLKNPDDPLWDLRSTPDVRESRDQILKRAFDAAVKMGSKAQGNDIRNWRWGKAHTAVFRNLTLGRSGIGLIEHLFNRGPIPVAGGFQQVFCTDWKPSAPFGVYAVSSMRQIIDLSNLSASVAINATGESGHAGNRHYDDMIDAWSKVRYHATWWDQVALESSRPERLVLSPR